MIFDIFGVGTDIVKNSRIKKLIKNKKFIKRIFTSNEIEDSKKIKQKVSFFSKRFAAKEAFAKSLGTGFAHNINFKDINVSNKKSGKPFLTLSNNLKTILKRKLKLKKVKIFLSLSDEREYSVAYVITQKIK
ncbi:MAG: holo-ACP synthase [Candidatus Pelagibacter sp.]